MSDEDLIGKAESWDAVWKQLKEHNPRFYLADGTGLDCVLAEIRRLQKNDTRLSFGIEPKETPPCA
jgi:hypothetical protein